MTMTLTAEQLSVVNLVSGRHLVLAPPGSGKTEMLSQRILRALAAGVEARKMLCATFTNRAAFEMRDRVSAAAGPDRALPDVGNLHHFCHRFLISVGRLHPGKHVLDETEQLDFVREVTDVLRGELHGGEAADLAKSHGVSVMPMIKGINEAMRQSLDELVEELFADYEEDDRSPYPDILSAVLIACQWRLGIPSCYLRQMPPQLHELLGRGVVDALERAYAGLKRKFQAVDFDDLVNETFLYLSKNPLPENRRFDWVQIDEVQDLNPLQWRIVRELTSARAVSVYFGDVEQSIFSFLGASASSFAAATADCQRHYFKTNFRATPLLLEVLMRYSLDCLRSEWGFLPVPSDVNRANGHVTLSAADSPDDVVGRVRQLLETGDAENVAILVRTNREADMYERHVRGLGHRTVKVSGRDLFAYPPMRDFLAFVSLFAGKPSRTAWASLVRRFADGVYRSSAARYFVRAMFASGWEAMSLFTARNPVPAVPSLWNRPQRWAWFNRSQLSSLLKRLKPAYDDVLPLLGRTADFREMFRAFSAVALGSTLRYTIRELVPEKKSLEEMLHRELTTDEARQYAFRRMELFLRYVEFVYRTDSRPLEQVLREDWQRLSRLKEADLLVGDEKIVISTIHKAKGRQFDAVIVPAADAVAGKADGDGQDESRRLLYVAMSRAKRHLSLFGCGPNGVLSSLIMCFRPDYAGYYLRRARGEDLSGDWLFRWERLATAFREGRCPTDLVEPALRSSAGAVVRMALKTLCHHADPAEARRLWLDFLGTTFAETAIGCLRNAAHYDDETVRRVRAAALAAEEERTHRAALAYFKLGVASASDERALPLAAMGDFIYHRKGEIRLEAATALDERGVGRWQRIVRGASSDFARLQTVDDDAHEESIRAILAQELPDEYERRLRAILHARAKRKT